MDLLPMCRSQLAKDAALAVSMTTMMAGLLYLVMQFL
jgi:hypothetical protein